MDLAGVRSQLHSELDALIGKYTRKPIGEGMSPCPVGCTLATFAKTSMQDRSRVCLLLLLCLAFRPRQGE